MGVPLRKKKKCPVGELDDTERVFDERGQGQCGTATLQTVLYRVLHTVCTTEILVASAQLMCNHLDTGFGTHEQRGRAGLVVHEWAGVILASSQRESMLPVDPVSQIKERTVTTSSGLPRYSFMSSRHDRTLRTVLQTA